jgi:hypothetical protein
VMVVGMWSGVLGVIVLCACVVYARPSPLPDGPEGHDMPGPAVGVGVALVAIGVLLVLVVRCRAPLLDETPEAPEADSRGVPIPSTSCIVR